MRILVAVFIYLITFSPAFCQLPDPYWVIEFRHIVKGMDYISPQASLLVLLETKAGDCGAFAKLGVSIAHKHNLQYEAIMLKRKTGSFFSNRHIVVVVRGHEGDLWLISNDSLYQIKSWTDVLGWDSDHDWEVQERIWFVGEDLDWSIRPKTACLIILFCFYVLLPLSIIANEFYCRRKRIRN